MGRWLNQLKQKSEQAPKLEPTKGAKGSFDGFEGPNMAAFSNSSLQFLPLRDEMVRLNQRWQQGIKLVESGKIQTPQQQAEACRRFSEISPRAEVIWLELEAHAPELLTGLDFLEP